jgi:hypothetical protein
MHTAVFLQDDELGILRRRNISNRKYVVWPLPVHRIARREKLLFVLSVVVAEPSRFCSTLGKI